MRWFGTLVALLSLSMFTLGCAPEDLDPTTNDDVDVTAPENGVDTDPDYDYTAPDTDPHIDDDPTVDEDPDTDADTDIDVDVDALDDDFGQDDF